MRRTVALGALPFVAAFLATAALATVSVAVAVGGYEPGEERPGGAATSLAPRNANAFSQASANLPAALLLDFRLGDGIFRKQWASAPSSTTSSDGLGPLYNARACQNCHFKDGRGQVPMAGEQPSSLILKIAVEPRDDAERAALAEHRLASIPEPTYGAQLQTFAIQGFDAEARVAIEREALPVSLSDSTVVTLKRPRYRLSDLAYGPMRADAVLSPRLAPPMIGLGLLALIPEAEVVAREKAAKPDGVSGVAQRAWSEAEGRVMLGRFGWKATQPTVADQVAAAFALDMGLSTPLRHQSSGDCTKAQAACLAALNGDDPREGVEVTRTLVDLVLLYAGNLAVPARVDADAPRVLQGKRLFAESGCAECHVPRQVTGDDPKQPHLARQTIYPYTDLLLHDLGDDLADGMAAGLASGRHWRTAPLWGLGLTRTVSGHTRFLHDGRAENALEAILWHGGEARVSRDRFRALAKPQRAALLTFLESL